MQNANSTWLNGRSFDRDLEVALAAPVRLANDANCFALSEASDGAAENAHTVFGVILGTGCGGGLVVNGKVARRTSAALAENGAQPAPLGYAGRIPRAPLLVRTQRLLETWVSGPGMAADHDKVTGETHTAIEIADRARAWKCCGEGHSLRHADRLARGLAHVVNIVDPDVLVLGGGLSHCPISTSSCRS